MIKVNRNYFCRKISWDISNVIKVLLIFFENVGLLLRIEYKTEDKNILDCERNVLSN